MSEEKGFYPKLVEIIQELEAPKIQWNKFGNYNFRSAEDILGAVKPLATERGLFTKLTDELVLIGDRYYIKATASITDGVNTESAVGYARESATKKGMDDSQITGTASSYARKYAMNGLYQIDDTKDADTNEYSGQDNNGPTNNQSNKASSVQVELLKKKINEYCTIKKGDKKTFEEFLNKQYNVDSIYNATSDVTINVINFVSEKIAKA